MAATDLRGRDFITLMEFDREEVETILDTSHDIKRKWIRG